MLTGLMYGEAIYGKSKKMVVGNVFILGATNKNTKSPPYWRFFGTIYASIKRQVYCGRLSDALLAPDVTSITGSPHSKTGQVDSSITGTQ
jgi:hypothetical protein